MMLWTPWGMLQNMERKLGESTSRVIKANNHNIYMTFPTNQKLGFSRNRNSVNMVSEAN